MARRRIWTNVRNLNADALTHIIARSCEIKALVVGQDERESDSVGRRAILNYGHTVGHAFEAVGEYGALLARRGDRDWHDSRGAFGDGVGHHCHDEGTELIERQTTLFTRCDLPTARAAGLNWPDLWAAMALDKKNRGASINFILPSQLGEMVKIENVSEAAAKKALETSNAGRPEHFYLSCKFILKRL